MISLVPGYELNLAIERQILGQKFPSKEKVEARLSFNKLLNRWKKPSPRYYVPVGISDDECVYAYASKKNGVYDWKFDILDYSRDIDDAMRLVRFMRKDGFSFKLFQPSDTEIAPQAIVSFVCAAGPCQRHGNKENNHHGSYDIAEKTLPLAICHAALAAKKAIPA